MTSENTNPETIEETGLAPIVESTSLEAALTATTQSYCSFKPESDEDRAMLYNGMNNPDFRLGNEVGQVIQVKAVYVEMVNLVKEDTGEVTTAPRIVLFDADGKSHVAVSVGVLSALQKLFIVFGKPTAWTAPLPLMVKQITNKERRMFTLEYATPAGKKK